MTISVLILTLNEAVNIADCIASLPWRYDVHVLDSLSTDDTLKIAEQTGAKVHLRPFTNYAEQRNYGFELPFAYEWIVVLDADERMTPELAQEIEASIESAEVDHTMYRVRRKDMFMGRWLRRASGYPTWFPRVFRRGQVRVEREINEEYVTSGTVGQLNGHLIHYPFSKGLEYWFERHNRYSSMEALTLTKERSDRVWSAAQIFDSDVSKRRAALKQLGYRLPGRPVLFFIYLYFVRLGFLDGYPGFQYANMRMAYEIMIDTKIAAARYEAHLIEEGVSIKKKGPKRKGPGNYI